ncbi:MAG: hypothetical protein WC238_05635 [Parcubacteria group bacterium]|jgi:hypothetical protein
MKTKKRLEEFVRDHKLDTNVGLRVITFEDLAQLKSEGCSIEEMLNYLSKNYNRLLHGSRNDICDGELRLGEDGRVYASDMSAVAILKAIFSREGRGYVNLRYPFFTNIFKPFKLKIEGINNHTIGERGFVYVVDRDGFRNEPKGSWQYVRESATPILAKISIQREDFNYPVFDVTNGNRRIQ